MSIFDHFQNITLTNDQFNAVKKLDRFLSSDTDVFLLKGYAGSGKTTLLKGLVDHLIAINKSFQLMAPTGRAAKVINQKTGFVSTTVHKGIYCFDELVEIKESNDKEPSFLYQYKVSNNPEVHDSILIVDEASMLSDVISQGEFFRFGTGRLLSDLIAYSRIALEGTKVKFIFIGDPAQLPPIGMSFSPGLDSSYIENNFDLDTMECELKEVKRQDSSNSILERAAKIRKCLTSGFFNDFDLSQDGVNIFNPTYNQFIETYKSNNDNAMIITYKNKTALDLNTRIRTERYGSDLPIQASDQVIIAGNNYRHGIMNGEFAIVTEVSNNTEERDVSFYTDKESKAFVKLIWRSVVLILPDENGDAKSVSGMMLENFLAGDNHLTSEEQRALYIDFKNRHPKLKPKTEEFKQAILNDKYFNCILLKYGYAVTCHKAQGGEWKNAFVFWDRGVSSNFNFHESPHNKIGKTNSDFYRWAYTAITRASESLYCINPPYFTSFSDMTLVNIDVQEAYADLTGKAIHPTEVEYSDEIMHLFTQFGLSESSMQIQNHFVKLWIHLLKEDINIVSWERIGYELRYVFERESATAAIKFWVNGKDEFKNNFQHIPGKTTSHELLNFVSKSVLEAPEVHLNRNNVEGILTKVKFDVELEESKPFLKSLFDALSYHLETYQINIVNIEHLEYKERYSFARNGIQCVVDFEYNGKGLFGRVLPLPKRCQDGLILTNLKQVINKVKKTNNV